MLDHVEIAQITSTFRLRSGASTTVHHVPTNGGNTVARAARAADHCAQCRGPNHSRRRWTRAHASCPNDGDRAHGGQHVYELGNGLR